jgi:mRNA interferase YafQ
LRTPVYRNKFKSEYKDSQKNPVERKYIDELKAVMIKLQNGEKLPEKYQDHALHGEYKDCRGCHILPDWVLIYRIAEKENEIHFLRLGSHSNLYE